MKLYFCKQILTYIMRQKTEIRQEQIKQAVLDIIYTDGLKSLSTRALAIRTGISEGTIFRHFASKQDIAIAIIRDVQNEFIEILRTIVLSKKSPVDRLHEFLCTTVHYLQVHKGITLLLFTEASHNNDDAMKQHLKQIFNSQKVLMSKIIYDGVSSGIWDEKVTIEDALMLYMSIPVSLNMDIIMNSEEYMVNSYCDKTLDILLKMLHN